MLLSVPAPECFLVLLCFLFPHDSCSMHFLFLSPLMQLRAFEMTPSITFLKITYADGEAFSINDPTWHTVDPCCQGRCLC